MNEGRYMSHPLIDLLNRLDEAGFHYTLKHNREDTIAVTVKFAGELIEIDVFEDGHTEVSRFLGTEDILGGQELIYKILEEKYKKKHE
jgi:hypothetical protein